MGTRLELQSKLEELLGCRHVYFQPPESVKMEYPAIVYSRSSIKKVSANNTGYLFTNKYSVVVIDKKPDNPVISMLLMLPYCAYDTSYKSKNLYHDVLSLYF